MRVSRWILLAGAGAGFGAVPALAADALKFGPPPAWVVQQAIAAAPVSAKDRPVAILLHDQQTALKPGEISTFSELAYKIQTPEGLAAGNIGISWNPATDTIFVNKLEIHRGTQVIDVLASGQKFTTVRREPNLEAATLDGVLTASMQPEGLQEGDIVVLATTTDHSDPVLKGHVETIFAPWSSAQIALAHARVEWPTSVNVKVQASGDLPVPRRGAREGITSYELTKAGSEPVIAPKGAPVRFGIGRMGEATDFRSWADAARLMLPLYTSAAVIPATGPLRDELEKIRKASPDPRTRAEQALSLIQDRVRYVALLMGEGGYVPTNAQATWERRFGDCKAKTALLLALLHELGISAEAVLANLTIGDAISDRLPMIGVFNHVFVRAHIGSRDYWLDGTRSGDTALDAIETPNYGWVLPLVDGAQLVHLSPSPLKSPSLERLVDIDATAGVYATAAITLTETYRGDSAIELNGLYASLSASQRDEVLRREANQFFDEIQVSSSSLRFDKALRKYTIMINGSAKLNWNRGWFYVPTSSIAFDPDFTRPAGPFQAVPIAVNHPRYVMDTAKIKLPAGFAARQKLDAPVHATLAGVEYARTEIVSGDTLTVDSSERSLVPEVPYKEALAAAARLKSLNEDDTYLRLADDYRPSEKDVTALTAVEPGSANEFVDRGNTLMTARKFDEAIADFTKALSIEPKNVIALADRGIAYVWTNKNDLADKDLDAAFAIEPENAIVHRARGLKAESAGDCASAIESYARSLNSEPQNGFAHGHRAICENRLGRYSEAIADAELALKDDPNWGELRALRLDSFARLGQKDAAAREADQLAKESPQTLAANWIAVGTLYAHAGLQLEAVAAFDKALAIKPEPSTYIARSGIRLSTDFSGRMADIEAALKLEPLDSDALSAKADLLADQGDLNAALAIYDKMVKAHPGQSPLSLRRGILLYKLGRTAEGERLVSAWRRGALTATELNEICWKKATAGILLRSALQDCDEALHINPNFVPALDSLAFVNLRLGKYKEAVTLYDRSVLKGQFAASFMGRALAYRNLGEAGKANTDRSEAIRRDAGIETRFASYGLKFNENPAPQAKAN